MTARETRGRRCGVVDNNGVSMRSMIGMTAVGGVLAIALTLQVSADETPQNRSTYIPNTQFQSIAQKIPAKNGKPGGFSAHMFGASTYSMSFIRLSQPDSPHVHGSWSEVYVVRAGSGVLETNGTVTGITSNNSAVHQSMFVDAQGNPVARAAPPAGASANARSNTDSGDLAGTGIEGGTRQAVKAGDVILIPAGTAHRWLAIDTSVEYLDIKFPKAQ